MPEYIEDGNVGYLGADQFNRFQWAVHNGMKLIPWLRVAGYIRGGEDDELKHRSNERPLGLPPTWIAAEEISRLLNELNQYPELEDAANDEFGAWLAEELTREVETAGHKWPVEDRPHKVRYVGCMACNKPTLRYLPPRTAGDRIVVKCSDKTCGSVMDEDMFAFAVKVIEDEQQRLGQNARRTRNGAQVETDDSAVGDRGAHSDMDARAGEVA